jgi:hypothetical protein
MKMTKAQREALAKLAAAQPFKADQYGYIHTGVNTRVLWSLKKAGLISVGHVYLGGAVAADLQLTGQEVK